MAFEKFKHTYLPAEPEVWSNSKIIIDEEKCNGCSNCVSACPAACLEIVDKKARVVEGVVCLSCSACVSHCERDAISMQGFYNVEEGLFKTMLLHPDDGYPNLPEVEGIEGMTPVEEVIYKRRSNRLFSKKPVSDELVRRVIEAGRFAPSHGNNQPWSFIVINDREEMDKIADKMDPMYRLDTAFFFSGKTNPITRKILSVMSYFAPPLMDQRGQTGGKAILKPKDVFMGAPCLIVILGDKRGISNMDLDCGICAQNMILAAHSLGLVTCYLGFLAAAAQLMPWLSRYLGARWPYKVAMGIVLGYPRVNADSMVKRELPRITWRKGGKSWTELP
jgi:nitroreductase/Pyruvate/2-oxoacid:ferredoxin oxidoreductase delta subunit